MKKTLTLIAAVCSIVCANAQGKPFTAGNIVIYRVGDGTKALGTSAAPVFIDEYSTATALLGTSAKVQSIALPATSGSAPTGNFLLTAEGSGTTEGQLTRSSDGKYIVFTGYNSGSDTSATSVPASPSTTTARVIGTIDSVGNVNTSTALTNFASKYAPRGVASPDGNTFFLCYSNTGIYTATLTGTTVTKVSANSKTKSPAGSPTCRSIEIFNDSIYASYQSTFLPDGVGTQAQDIAMATIGSINTLKADTAVTVLPGIDTTYPSSTTTPPTKTSPYQFVMMDLPGGRVMYIADAGTNGALLERGIQKYSLQSSGSWSYDGSIYAAGCVGLTGHNSGDTVVLFATSKNKLFGAVDVTGWGQAPFGPMPGDSAIELAKADTLTGFRGVAFTPGTPSNLAVTLKSFNGSLVNGFAKLTWSTASEINAKGFEIEKSIDGKNFTSIGSLAANNKPSSYEFTDPTKLAGLQYYRLKLTNKDGSYSYSSNVALNAKVAIKLGVYPNPVVSSAIISHPQAVANASLKIISINGKTIATYPVQIGATETTVDVSRLVKGSYIVSFENNSTRETTQFVK